MSNYFLIPQVERVDGLTSSVIDGQYNGEFQIYLSVPFCASKCKFCPFFKNRVSTSDEEIEEYVQDATKLFFPFKERFKTARCTAIYFGGGTASLLKSHQVNKLHEHIFNIFRMDSPDITLEGSPADFTKQYLSELAYTTRISLGIQSYHQDTLKVIGSRHTIEDAKRALNDALSLQKFKTINVDHLFGIKGVSVSEYYEDLDYTKNLTNSITLYRYESKENSLDRESTWEIYRESKRRLTIKLHEEMFGFFVEHMNKYNNNLRCANEMIGIGPGSYSFINDRQIKVENNYKGFFQNTNFNKYTHISKPDRDMRRLIFGLLFGYIDASLDLRDKLLQAKYVKPTDFGHLEVVEDKKKEYKKMLSLALGITEELEGYPYF